MERFARFVDLEVRSSRNGVYKQIPGCAAKCALSLDPGQRFIVIPEYLDVGIDEDARQPGLPGEPLIVGDHGDLAEVVVVLLAEEFDLFPGYVDGVVDHCAQIEQQVDLSGCFQLVKGLFLERLEVVEGEFAEDGNVEQVVGLFDGDHFSSLSNASDSVVSLAYRRRL